MQELRQMKIAKLPSNLSVSCESCFFINRFPLEMASSRNFLSLLHKVVTPAIFKYFAISRNNFGRMRAYLFYLKICSLVAAGRGMKCCSATHNLYVQKGYSGSRFLESKLLMIVMSRREATYNKFRSQIFPFFGLRIKQQAENSENRHFGI